MNRSMCEDAVKLRCRQLLFFSQYLLDLVFRLVEVPCTLKSESLVLQYRSTA